MVNIGDPIQTYKWFLRRGGVQGVIFNFYNDSDLTQPRTELDGQTITIKVGSKNVKTFTTVCVGNKATFALNNPDTADLAFQRYDGVILDGNSTPIANLRIEVEPN